ncbi:MULTISPECIES: type II secretion system inner membrane protein GspF [Pseudomonas]|jgi:general secretion pathway protein F|uniref:type II secretion system inner membrane protein GspF n=1 Tax=Pseudomonas TaxID=286 RepID=UPI00099C2140|nr:MULTISPECIES: type II secretion system inner membrane protein GspF [Pseudomonas]MCK3838875.1 type II secretion system protein GspF [Pseudomonas sp. NCIMB 10586]OPB05919.1 type II secretion system protein GspF [Pseudomonas synxantha]VCU67854.1 general secretion pathway protein GspF [Pseudomonas synxantha]
MAAYEYLAMDAKGQKSTGVLDVESERQARRALRERQLITLKVTPARAQSTQGSSLSSYASSRLSSSELALLTRQMATLVQASLAIEEVLAAVANECKKQRQKNMLMSIRAKVLEGYGLAYALGQFPRAFPDLYRATVAAGERSGHLGSVLLRLADHTEARQAARQQMQLALLYPSVLLVTAISIVGFLLGYVVPDVINVFLDSGQTLPILTRALVAISTWLQRFGLLLLLSITALSFAVRLGVRTPRWRTRWDAFVLRLPLAGGLISASSHARFISTLAILGRSGVPLLEALEIAGEVVINRPIRAQLKAIANAVREGVSLTRAIELNGRFPPMMLYMIASGERSGDLDNMLDRAAKQQEQQLSTDIALLVGLFEPTMLVFMGGSVLLIVLAILMPILSLNQLIT